MAKREDNLRPYTKGSQSREELKRKQHNGGVKSGEVRRAKKTMKQMLDYLLEKEIENSKTGEKKTTLEAMMTATIAKAIKGDVRASEFVRDTIGQKPVDRQEVMQIEAPKIIDNI